MQLHKRPHRAAARQRCRLWAEKLWESQNEHIRRKWRGEQRTSLNEHRCLDTSHLRKRNNVDGGINHLLLLAQSAELLLESEHDFHSSHPNNQSHEGSPLNQIVPQLQNPHNNLSSTGQCPDEQHVATQVGGNSEVGKTILPLQRRTRLTQFRRQARSRNARLVQGMNEDLVKGYMGCQSIKDTQNLERVHAKQVRESMNQQVVKEPAANCDFQMREGMDGVQVCEKQDSQYTEVQKHFCSSRVVDEIHVGQLRDEMDHQCDTAPTVERMHEDQICQERDHKCNSAQRKKDRSLIRDGQRERRMKHFHLAAPQQLELTVEGREQLSLQMTDELQQPRKRQRIARQVRLKRTNAQRGQSRNKDRNDAQPEQIHVPIEQIRVSNGRRNEQLSTIEPQWLLISEMQRVHRFNARHRLLLRTSEWRKQRREKLSDVSNGNHGDVEHQWFLQMGYILREHQRFAARQLRARRITERRASKNVLKCLNRGQVRGERNVCGGIHHVPAVTKAQSGELLLEAEPDFHESVGNNCEDQCVEQKSSATNVNASTEVLKNNFCVKGRTRLNHLKREARLRHAHLLGRISEGQMDCRSNNENISDAGTIEGMCAELVQEEIPST
ncbi:uncharacterized protein LOC143848599 isoform X2 [Tasmannia lanceolata]|uniref:uncharacterized protein LOC143848599 isoform X2 n=1 Tax=Tasmannia lanceolata TaxID=3420 RepID=UPI0040640348